jgi:ribosome-binding factor A
METKRQNKISKLLQKDIGDIFQKEVRSLFGNTMISVTKVYVTSDLSIAKVYVSLFATEDKEELLKNIIRHTRDIRHALGRRIKNQLRQVPELQFYLDDSLDYIENIENLLNNKS